MILIHQVYLDFGNHFWCDIFEKSKKSWENFEGYTLWDIEKIENFLIGFPQYKPLWDKIEKPICKVDYIRICIVKQFGGLYIDLDVINDCGHLEWIKGDNFFNRVDFGNKKGLSINNDLFYLNRPNHPIFDEIIDYFDENFDRLQKIDVYKNRIWRYILQSFGPDSFKRYLTKYKKIKQLKFIEVKCIKHGKIIKYVENSPLTIIYRGSWATSFNGFNPKNKKKYKDWCDI
tara:strand:- start:68 stop:760 length:693 start_codon:yes stop_codon:yes gene_type:complete